MSGFLSEAIEEYVSRHCVEENALLAELAKETREKAEMPQMMVGPTEGAFLRFLVRMVGARHAIEIGTFTGYSSLWIAEGLPADGQLVTLDLDMKSLEMARYYWARSPHGRKITWKIGDALDTLKLIQGPVDFIFIDADKENYLNYWRLCVPKLRRGGIIVVDNVLWGGRVVKPEDKLDFKINAFNAHVMADKRVESVMLPVRDGITVALKVE
jgi:caffeoyl-CoA O-methyltransferase